MKKTKKKGKGINYSSMRCPYCGGSVIFRSADGIYKDNSKGTMLYVCSRYPECPGSSRMANVADVCLIKISILNFVEKNQVNLRI